jgi:hypothetical protein
MRVNKSLLLDIIDVNGNSHDHHFGGQLHLDTELRGAK